MCSCHRLGDHSRVVPIVLAVLPILLLATSTSLAEVSSSTLHALGYEDLNDQISSDDLIQGRMSEGFDVLVPGYDSFGYQSLPGWHPVNTDPADQLAAFTDGLGIRDTGFSGLLNDNFPVEMASGRPAKIIEYPFESPTDIGRINLFSGNRNNADGRIFSTVYIEYATGGELQPLGYFQSDPSGSINQETNPVPPFDPPQHATLLSIFDDASATMLTGITTLVFNFYSVDNTQGENRDPFDGLNPFTNTDDGLTAAFVSPIIYEIDVLAPQAALDGDFNHDNFVDAADYTVWRDGLGAEFELADYTRWKENFGSSQPASGAAVPPSAAPEPNALVLAILGVLLVCVVRRAHPKHAGLSS